MGNRSSTAEGPIEDIGSHDGIIECMAISGDRSTLVTGCEDTFVRVWSLDSSRTEILCTLRGHSSYITAVAIYDSYVVSGSDDSTIRKWDLSTRNCIYIYEGHTLRISEIIITADLIFSSSSDKTARAWALHKTNEKDDQQEACVRVFEGHVRAIYPIIYIDGGNDSSRDNGYGNMEMSGLLLTGSADFTARSWSVYKEITLKTFTGHSGPIMCMATDARQQLLFTGSADRTIRQWRISRGECLRVMKRHTDVVLSLISCQQLLCSSSSNGEAYVWVQEYGDLVSRSKIGISRQIPVIKMHKGVLFTGSADAYIRAFDPKTGTLLATFKGHVSAITCMEIAKGKLISGSSDERLLVWNIEDLLNTRTSNYREDIIDEDIVDEDILDEDISDED